MTPYLVGGALVLVAAPLGPLLGRVAGPRSGPVFTVLPPVSGAVRAGAAVAAVVVAVGETEVDLFLLAVLTAVAVGRRLPAVTLAVVATAATAALRVGSSSLPDVTGAHSVLGPALLSPRWEVALPAVLVLAAGLVALPAVLPEPLPSRGLLASPDRLADALTPIAVALLTLIGTVGPPLADHPDAMVWTAVRVAVVLGALPAAALARRLVSGIDDTLFGAAAAILAATALFVAVTAA